MKLKLVYCNSITTSAEVTAIKAFLDWQQINYESHDEMRLLRLTHGKPYPVLLDENEDVVAINYFSIIKWIQSQGLLLC